jgi:alanine-glyoxylate transaminase/serine-glyoxylate transaminase/serine-pyruvate transaminase
MLRKLFQTTDPSSQPFVISGSGTLGWDLVAANLAEPGDDVLVLHTGYFADSFADCFETYGVKATQLTAPIGSRPQLPEIEKALKEKKYKLLTVTHVDTSTGVLSELKALSELVHRVSPETLLIVDGVCSVGCEEIEFDKWQLDGVITASQKAIGCPAGLSISMYSGRAIKSFQSRKTPPGSYFASFKNWLPSKPRYQSKFCSSLMASLSYAELRSQESFLLCYSFTSADTCPSHLAESNTFQATVRTFCNPSSNITKNQESHHRPWTEAISLRPRGSGKWYDRDLSP